MRFWLPVGAGLLALIAATSTQAAGGSGGCNSCTAPPPPCNCVPTTHQVNIPGVNITPPTVNVTIPELNVSSNASASATASAQAVAVTSASSNNYYAVGGGSSWYVDQSSTGVIPNLHVEGVGQSRQICVEKALLEKTMAVEAVCLDDKAVPHPASQVLPEREVAGPYEGEVYRCIAGARMQYTIGEYTGGEKVEHGQTRTCEKGEALYHSLHGLECRPQKPARDCNERSLLRRYGAGIKLIKLPGAEVCKEWRTETVASQASGSLLLDGGVGGVVH
jgi:hypothetical protein